MGGGEQALDVGGDHAVPLLGVGADDGAQEHQAGVVDQGVQPSESFDSLLDGRLGLGAVGDVGVHGQRSPIYANPVRPPNNARFAFLDPQATEFFGDWDTVANDTVALLRAEAGRDPTTGS